MKIVGSVDNMCLTMIKRSRDLGYCISLSRELDPVFLKFANEDKEMTQEDFDKLKESVVEKIDSEMPWASVSGGFVGIALSLFAANFFNRIADRIIDVTRNFIATNQLAGLFTKAGVIELFGRFKDAILDGRGVTNLDSETIEATLKSYAERVSKGKVTNVSTIFDINKKEEIDRIKNILFDETRHPVIHVGSSYFMPIKLIVFIVAVALVIYWVITNITSPVAKSIKKEVIKNDEELQSVEEQKEKLKTLIEEGMKNPEVKAELGRFEGLVIKKEGE